MHQTLPQNLASLLFIVGRPNWAHEFKTRNLMRVLGSEYDARFRYQSDVTEEDVDQATLILVYFWLQFEAMQPLIPAFRRNRHKLLVGISSSYELEEDRRDRGLAVLRDLASGVFIHNLLLYREFQPLLKLPTFYTPNGVDTGFYKPGTRKPPASSMLRVGWAGSLTNQGPAHRGYHEFIVPAAAAAGAELLTAAREHKWRGPEEMREFYRSLDVYVCASRTEGTPNPCLEAAACGVPLVTTCVGNMPELVRDGISGFFVKREVDDIAGKLGVLRDDVNLRTKMSTQIQNDIQAWDWSFRSRAYRNMFQEMVSKAEVRDRVSLADVKEPVRDGADNSESRVVALISAYNEEDIIVPCLHYLIKQGLQVYLIDNWSTDSTVELASDFLGKGLLAIEKFPREGPPTHYRWKDILSRIEQVSEEIDADWFLFQDVDEIITSPWPGLGLRDAILKVDRERFNCIDHTIATFYPVDNDFAFGADLEAYFKYFEFSDRPAQFVRTNAWKNVRGRVTLAKSGGHEIRFEGRRPYPFRFLLKHYPVRSQAHGEKKIFKERKARWLPQERANGWHTHYDHINKGHSFIRRPENLKLFNETEFRQVSVDHSPPLIDWAFEQIRAMRTQPAKILTYIDLERRKTEESIQSLAGEVRRRWLDVTVGGTSRKNERERNRVAFKRSRRQLAQRDKNIQVLLDQLANQQDVVESLAGELSETQKIVVTLFTEIADGQQSVGESSGQVNRVSAHSLKHTLPLSWHALYENVRSAFPRPVERLLKRKRRRG